MPDIRLVRRRGSNLWVGTGALAVLATLVWALATFGSDPTDPAQQPRVGAAARFGENRAPVIPPRSTPFQSMLPLRERDLGRLVHVTGVAATPVVANAVWVQTPTGEQILLRFEPAPPPGTLAGIGPGSRIGMDGYVERIARAEFKIWADTLGVSIPRPPPGRKFGDLPDPEFARVDSLFIKDFYLSVRPEGVTEGQ